MPRIVFIVHSFNKTHLGGVLKVVSMLANEFCNRGIEVRVLSLANRGELAYALDSRIVIDYLNLKHFDTRTLRGVSKLSWFFRTYSPVLSYIRRNPDAIYITSSPPLSMLLGLFSNKYKVVGCDHTSTTYNLGGVLQYLRNLILRRLNVMIGLTPEDVQYYEANGINSSYIPNPVLRQQVMYENTQKFVVFIGRFSEDKNPLEALAIFYKSKIWKKGVILKMYGYGELKESMVSFIKTKNLTAFVIIIEDESNLENMLKDVKCLLLTSPLEGFGMVLVEAMSFGIPCISYDSKYGPRNIIVDGKNGFLINFEDQEKFVEKLQLVFSNKNNFNADEIKLSITDYYLSSIMEKWKNIL